MKKGRSSSIASVRGTQDFIDGEDYEIRGTLVDISTRFWNSWGYGTVRTDKGEVRITGALEGHILGTGLIVRGKFKAETKYGAQIAASAIAVDEITPTLAVIRTWAESNFPEFSPLLVDAVRDLPVDERWEKLSSREFLTEQGISAASEIAMMVAIYLKRLEEKRELLELGFTNKEADKIFKMVKSDDVSALIRENIYTLVMIGFSFTRIDSIAKAKGLCTRDTDNRRLLAATVAALRFAESNGHTALREDALLHELAKVAGIYREDANAFYAQHKPSETSRQFRKYGDFVQRARTAEREDAIAYWVAVQAVKAAEES